jgi:hypothetical protein
MIKRVTWFVSGVAAGAAGAGYAKRKVRRTVQRTAAQLAPATIAKQAAGKVRQRGRHVADAVREGREAMRARELELRARRDDHVETLEQHLAPGDQLFVDGRPVDSAQVIVLRQPGQPGQGSDAGDRAGRRQARRRR